MVSTPSPRIAWPAVSIQAMFALGGIVVVLFATAGGIGLSPDSSAYLSAARSLLDGHGVSNPLAQGRYTPMVFYAPLFSALVAVLGLSGIDVTVAARGLNVALLGVNILLSGHIVHRESGSSAAAICTSALVAISLPVLEVHSMAWSEPAFVLFSLLAVLWLNDYWRQGSAAPLVAAGVATGCAILSRYAGTFMVGAGLIVVLLRHRHVTRGLLRDGVMLVAASAVVCGGPLLRNWLVAGTLTAHPAAFHPIGFAECRNVIRTVGRWFWITAGPRRLSGALVAIGAFVLLARRMARRAEPQYVEGDGPRAVVPGAAALIFACAYCLFLLFAISFFDASTAALDDRLLSPLLVWSLIAGACIAEHLFNRGSRAAGAAMAFVAVWFAVAQLTRVVPWALTAHREGQGYASPAWRQAAIIDRIRALPDDTLIFSNGDDAIYLLAGRTAERVPERVFPTTAGENGAFRSDLARMRRRLADAHGVIVYFSRIDWRSNLITAAELQQEMRVRTIYVGADGIVFGDGES